MMPDASQWRSAARYDHVEKLTASGLAWEWLRRNEAYNQDFEALSGKETDTTVLTEKIRQRWRLRFPSKPVSRSHVVVGFLDVSRRHQRCRPDVRACCLHPCQ